GGKVSNSLSRSIRPGYAVGARAFSHRQTHRFGIGDGINRSSHLYAFRPTRPHQDDGGTERLSRYAPRLTPGVLISRKDIGSPGWLRSPKHRPSHHRTPACTKAVAMERKILAPSLEPSNDSLDRSG